ncbi:hypothetical protein IT400_01960 [Candidatus Nomurabacteria bacterium]|nr:hypothetical protein [Candidatus Nomurabacteria bacterium]
MSDDKDDYENTYYSREQIFAKTNRILDEKLKEKNKELEEEIKKKNRNLPNFNLELEKQDKEKNKKILEQNQETILNFKLK